jgi:hypothetical protein
MAITRANVEATLIKRLGQKMTAAGLDGTTFSGSNTDLNDPIGTALRTIGVSVSDISLVTNSDLSGITGEQIDALLDLSELRTLQNIAGNLTVVDQSIGPRDMSLSQLSNQVEKAIQRLTERIAKVHGYGVGSLDASVISLDFQEKPSDVINA